jgi:uncharacterized protein YceH (UPF0502 family)
MAISTNVTGIDNMELQLSAQEARVLGCLIEKEMTTPEYYPLSLNALTNACNQKSNRDPVMHLDESDVVRCLDTLRFHGLAMQAASDGGRVSKYQHNLRQKLYLEPEELAILCELLLRGAQTIGELRNRCERMHAFRNLEEVETVLHPLATRKEPLLIKLPRQAGRKENRFAHLLCGAPDIEEPAGNGPDPGATRYHVEAQEARILALEEEIATLRGEVASLTATFAEFRSQFE